MKNGFCKVENGRIFYQIHGEGSQDIVWVHGMPLGSDSWHAQFQYFKSDFRNIALDLRGYGQSSELPLDTKNIADLYDADILALIDTLKLNNPILVGFASGGHATLKFAAKHSDRIKQLIVINASACFMRQKDQGWGFTPESLNKLRSPIEQATTLKQLSDLIFGITLNELSADQKEKLLPWLDRMLANATKKAILGFFKDIAYDDIRPLLQDISVPTFIINSTLGAEVPTETGLYLREHIKSAQFFELNDIDHFAFVTQSLLVNQVIMQSIKPNVCINIPDKKTGK